MIFIACAFLTSHLAGDGNAAGRQQAGAQDDRADRVFVGRIAGSLVVVRQRAEGVALDQSIQGDRGPGRALEFLRRAIRLDVERLAKLR